MKLRKYFSLLVVWSLILSTTANGADYIYNYSIDNVKYSNMSSTVEATVNFNFNTEITQDAKVVCYLVVYDATKKQMIDVSFEEYNIKEIFKGTKSLTQTVMLSDCTRETYEVKTIITKLDMITPQGCAENNSVIIDSITNYDSSPMEVTGTNGVNTGSDTGGKNFGIIESDDFVNFDDEIITIPFDRIPASSLGEITVGN